MTDDLRALLVPPQEARLRARFGLEGVPLHLITSGWQRLVVAAPNRVFVFPRHHKQVRMVQREAEVLAALGLDFVPRLLGLHRDAGISPYPFLELSRIPGSSYDLVEPSLSFDEVATCLEGLARRIAQWQHVSVPARFAARPTYIDAPRISSAWTQPDTLRTLVRRAAVQLRPHLGVVSANVWVEALLPIAALERTTVHGEVSDGQFLIDADLHVTGVVDWNGLHINHPLCDLDFGVGGYRIARWEARWRELRRRIWEAYVAERGIALPEWPCVNLFWCLLDARTLLQTDQRDARWRTALAELSEATDACK